MNDSKNSKNSNIEYKPRINTANSYFLQLLLKHTNKNNSNISKNFNNGN